MLEPQLVREHIQALNANTAALQAADTKQYAPKQMPRRHSQPQQQAQPQQHEQREEGELEQEEAREESRF